MREAQVFTHSIASVDPSPIVYPDGGDCGWRDEILLHCVCCCCSLSCPEVNDTSLCYGAEYSMNSSRREKLHSLKLNLKTTTSPKDNWETVKFIACTRHVSIRLRKRAIIWNSTGYHPTITTNTKLCRSHRNTYTKVRTYHASVASSSLVAGSSTDTI